MKTRSKKLRASETEAKQLARLIGHHAKIKAKATAIGDAFFVACDCDLCKYAMKRLEELE